MSEDPIKQLPPEVPPPFEPPPPDDLPPLESHENQMTEAEWLTCLDPERMLYFLRYSGSDRKLRLFSVACCQRVLPSIPDERNHKAVEVAELLADGLVNEGERQKAAGAAQDAGWSREAFNGEAASFIALYALEDEPFQSVLATSRRELEIRTLSRKPEEMDKVYSSQADSIRDIFGNPFRSVEIKKEWLAANDGAVVGLAAEIYDKHSFELMGHLADALTDTGCDNLEIIDHCRNGGSHVKGCWVLDLILGKN